MNMKEEGLREIEQRYWIRKTNDENNKKRLCVTNERENKR